MRLQLYGFALSHPIRCEQNRCCAEGVLCPILCPAAAGCQATRGWPTGHGACVGGPLPHVMTEKECPQEVNRWWGIAAATEKAYTIQDRVMVADVPLQPLTAPHPEPAFIP